jgi:hypothetical protein
MNEGARQFGNKGIFEELITEIIMSRLFPIAIIYFLFFMRFFLRRFRSLCLFIIFLRRFNVLIIKIPSSRRESKFCHHGLGVFVVVRGRSEQPPGVREYVAKDCLLLGPAAAGPGKTTRGCRVAASESRRRANMVPPIATSLFR